MGGTRDKHTDKGEGCRADGSCCLLYRQVSCDLEPPSSSWHSRQTQMVSSLLSINVLYTRVTFARFSEILPCLLFLKNKQLKIILMSEAYFRLPYFALIFCQQGYRRDLGTQAIN